MTIFFAVLAVLFAVLAYYLLLQFRKVRKSRDEWALLAETYYDWHRSDTDELVKMQDQLDDAYICIEKLFKMQGQLNDARICIEMLFQSWEKERKNVDAASTS